MNVIKKGNRLSVQPVTLAAFEAVKLLGEKGGFEHLAVPPKKANASKKGKGEKKVNDEIEESTSVEGKKRKGSEDEGEETKTRPKRQKAA